MKSTICSQCEAVHEVPEALEGQRLLCSCGAGYWVGAEPLSGEIESKLRERIESSAQSLSRGFGFVGACAVLLGFSSALSGVSRGVAGGLAGFGLGWILVAGRIRGTEALYWAKVAAITWVVAVMSVGLAVWQDAPNPALGLLVIAAAGLVAFGPVKVALELRSYQERLEGPKEPDPIRGVLEPPPLSEWVLRAGLGALVFFLLSLLVREVGVAMVQGLTVGVLLGCVAALESLALRIRPGLAAVVVILGLPLLWLGLHLADLQVVYTELVLTKGKDPAQAMYWLQTRGGTTPIRVLLPTAVVLTIALGLRCLRIRWRWHWVLMAGATGCLVVLGQLVDARSPAPRMLLMPALAAALVSFVGYGGEWLRLRLTDSTSEDEPEAELLPMPDEGAAVEA